MDWMRKRFVAFVVAMVVLLMMIGEFEAGANTNVDYTSVDYTNPVKVLENAQSVSLGEHSGAVTKDGTLYMWGDNGFGQLGLGDGMWGDRNSPVKVLENVRSISLGGQHSGAVTKDGCLYMWGRNDHGQLGDGTYQDRCSPVKVLENVQSANLDNDYSGAITKDGTLYMWGKNDYGQLGDGTWEDRNSPVKVLENIQSISLGGSHNGAVTRDGTLYMWGYNDYGQVGNGTNEEGLWFEIKPVKVLENVQSVSLGWEHSGAVTKDGVLYMWGKNHRGQLGDGTRQDHNSPVKVLENVQKASLEYWNSGAIAEDGSVYIWGANPWDPDDIVVALTEDSMPLIQKLTQKITFRTSAIKKGMVIYGTSFSLNAKTTGTGKLSYKSSNTKILSVNAKGKVTVKGYGPAYIQIKASGGDGYKAAVRKFNLTVVPGKEKVTKAEQEKGAVRFKWKPEKSVDGYEYAVAYNQKFSGQSRKKTKKTGLVLTKYKTGTKKMFLKVRAYKKIGKKIYYGSWSRPRWVKLKKGRKTGQASYSIVG